MIADPRRSHTNLYHWENYQYSRKPHIQRSEGASKVEVAICWGPPQLFSTVHGICAGSNETVSLKLDFWSTAALLRSRRATQSFYTMHALDGAWCGTRGLLIYRKLYYGLQPLTFSRTVHNGAD